MRVKVALPISKPLGRWAFLAGSSGQRTWVSFRYERLALFCHHCGLLGHDLKHCAQHFALTKGNRNMVCQYGEWMKASGSRVRSPNRRDQAREVDDHGNDERRTTLHQQDEMVETAHGGGRCESDTRGGADKCINDDNVNKGLAPEISLANPVSQEAQSTDKDVMEKSTLDEMFGPSMVGLGTSDGPTNESGNNRPQGLDKQRTWTRRAHMDFGPVENLKEGAKSVLGKRINQAQ
ncbi:hypothetical protein CFP56_011894 [Quercus suber]|uniref:Zinc knuckle CX2CX4HX4C domain-containing protein n=1 Tax=Quercus suber TaxID=58331 RepID=A0AAW0KYP4_QUESU